MTASTAGAPMSGVSPDPGTDRWRRVIDATGFDPARLDGTGTVVGVAGVGGVGVRSLMEAADVIDPTLGLRGYRPGDPEVGVALLVLDPSSAVGDEEVALLARMRADVGSVALVCGKIDAFWEWPRILRAHRALLDPLEEVPVFAVSALAALAGADDESGVGELLGWLRSVLNAPAAVRVERARVGAARGAVTAAALVDGDEIVAGPTADDLLTRRRALLGARDRGRTDRLAAVRTGLARVRSASLADAQTTLRGLTADAQRRCQTIGRGGMVEHAQWLHRELASAVVDVDTRTVARVDEVADSALLGLGPDPEATPEVPVTGVDTVARRPLPSGRRGAEDALLVLIGASTGLGIGRLVVAPMASVPALQWISVPLTVVLGIAVAVWVIRVRRTSVLRAEMRGWSTEVVAETRGRLEHAVGMRINAAESRMAGRIGRYFERRTRQAATEVSGIDNRLAALREADRTRGSTRRRDEERRRELSALHRDLSERSRMVWATDDAIEQRPETDRHQGR